MKSVMCSLLCLCLLGASASEPTVTYVTAQQRYQGNGKVDITVTLTGTSNDVVEAEYTFVATNSATHAALNVAHVTAVDGATGSGSTWTRKFVWNALADVGVVKIDDVVLTVDVESQYVQLWENGPYWAKCNLGASQPEEFGYYFWWGDTIGYKWQNSQWVASDGSKSGFCFEPVDIPTSNKSLAQLQSMGVVDADGNLQPAYDAAARQWGDDWRMPKVSEMNDLANLCSWNWTTNKGVVGFTVTGKGRYSGNSVFFPAAGWGIGAAINDLSVYGCYRTSTMGETADLANRLCFNMAGYVVHEFSVSWGYPIRPVKSLVATHEGVQLWENGPLWAKTNVGANSPTEPGYYFWWGDTLGYKWQNSQWVASDGSKSGFCFEPVDIPTSNKSLAQLQSMGVVDADGNLQPAYDAAARQWGDDWRMPKVSELNNLANLCSWNWTTNNGIVGFTVTGKGQYSGNSVFFPAAGWGIGAAINDLSVYGCYRTSTMGEAADLANRLCFNVTGYVVHEFSVSWGYPIRPVKSLAATTHLTLDYRGAIVAMGLTAKQRYPWNGLVDITVTLSGTSNDVMCVDCAFVATNSATHAALNVAHVTTVGGITGSGTTWTQKFVWDAKADVGAVKIDDVALTVDAKIVCVQLWENGPYWATCNVGASQPEESGYYFWWGDTVGYKRNASNNGWVSVKDGASFSFSDDNCPTYGMTTSQLQSAGYIDASGNLVAAHDAATAHLGAPWRLPTDAEFLTLVSNCTTTWTTRNGVQGRLVTGKGAYASKSIFLPAASDGRYSDLRDLGSYGHYWSSTPVSDDSNHARGLHFYSSEFYRNWGIRDYGQSVRPVRRFAQ